MNAHYDFKINILNHICADVFCFESFKKHFKLKTTRDTHLKLIEVFSYRHDLSQRRETVEAALKALLRMHNNLHIPEHLIEQQKEHILDIVQLNPDYYVYKIQADFKEKIHMLAEKQLKELALIDALAYQEQIEVSDEDIVGYINLLKRPRTKEFIYFTFPHTKMYGREEPLTHALIQRQCLREKTLNYAIQRLSRNR